MSTSVADLVNGAMARKRRPDGRPWGPYQLMGAIGLLEGDRPFNITQVQRLLSGERRTFDHRLIARLIAVLDLPEEETWHAAGLWPPDLDVEDYRKLRLASAASQLSARKVAQPLPLDVDPGEFAQLIDQNRPHLAVVVPLEPRRDRRQEDRRLHLVRPVVAEQVPA